MADENIILNYSDDSKIKQYIQGVLAPRVFKNIPLNVLNTGSLSLITEYLSQGIEQIAFTSSFYFNESFITKAVLADSIYAEAAIFNIGYSYAIPSSCNFLLELKIEDIHNNAVLNADNGLYEFILDKDTKFNLSNGNVYSLDYDILIQYKNVETTTLSSAIQAWNIQYTNKDQLNSVAKNKDTYIIYRVTDTWLCLLVQASEYERQVHTVVNNMANGIPNQDTVIDCIDHIAGFDIKYIDGDGNEQWIPHDHILPIHDSVKDMNPYVHYIMDSPQTIRFMWQLNGSKYFVPKVNSSYEITVYTCHGEAANFSAFNNEEQPKVITASNRYSNNGNVMKAAFVISGSMGGTNIGNIETVRRETIEAYNTANQIATDHDLDEYFKTFYFKNVLYPFFYKRRDDPWGRIWSGFIALKDDDDYVYRTNTLHGVINYDVLYGNNDNSINENEIIIPPGWVWTYIPGGDRHTLTPYCIPGKVTVEKANTSAEIGERFVFANPFGIRIQKDPFAIGYFNPWINEYVTCSLIPKIEMSKPSDDNNEDISSVYHATPIIMNVQRTYQNDFYKLTTYISPTISEWIDGSPMVKNVQQNSVAPIFPAGMWKYFNKPLDDLASDIPLLPLNDSDGRSLQFDPYNTYFCVKSKTLYDDDTWTLNGVFWILDQSGAEDQTIQLPITVPSNTTLRYYGDNEIWGNDGLWEPVLVTGDTEVRFIPVSRDSSGEFNPHLIFNRVNGQNYYELRLDDSAILGNISAIRVSLATKSTLTKYGEDQLYQIGQSMAPKIYINIRFLNETTFTQYEIRNAASVYIPWSENITPQIDENNQQYYEFDFSNVGANGIVLYADMKPSPEQGAIDYYRIKLSKIPVGTPLFYIKNNLLDVHTNNMRVLLRAMMNGGETGRIEMRPVSREKDGSYCFETEMYPLNELVDINDRINIASLKTGGGGWTSTSIGSAVSISAANPELKISVLVRSNIPDRSSDIPNDNGEYIGFRLVDEYSLDDVSFVQELKEMRSTVDFGESSIPTEEEVNIHNEMILFNTYNPQSAEDLEAYGNLNNVTKCTKELATELEPYITFDQLQTLSGKCITDINKMLDDYHTEIDPTIQVTSEAMQIVLNSLEKVVNTSIEYTVPTYDDPRIKRGYYYEGKFYSDDLHQVEITGESGYFYIDITSGNDPNLWNAYRYDTALNTFNALDEFVCWDNIDQNLRVYDSGVNEMFSKTNVNGGVEIQLIPFVQYSLMNSSRFKDFVSSFTQVHKAMEPVIMERLDGNNYLDCKLIATYGKPHTYCADVDVNKEGEDYFWPDLNVQIEFDVKLFNQALATNTLNELRLIVKSYFNRLTSIHTPVDLISMDNNIYISHLIQQMEEHDNVAYMKFKGWYTDEKSNPNGNYMDANIQAIVQKWRRLEDFPKYERNGRLVSELEHFVPEMFVMDDDNIKINIIK